MKDEKKPVAPVTPTKETPKASTLALPKLQVPVWFKYMFLPWAFLKFWLFDSPIALFQFFVSLNSSYLQFCSLPLLLRTYFQPLKNEYRKGLVGFSRAMGIIVKTVLITADTIILLLLLMFEITIFVSYCLFPVATIFLLFL